MENPFQFTGIATTPSFCNRKKECVDLTHYICNSQNVLLYSHRRFGKTSLLHKVLAELDDVTPYYIDLYGTTTVEEFITSVIQAITRKVSPVERAMSWLRDTLTRLTFQFSLDPISGLPVVNPTFHGGDQGPVLTELFGLMKSLSEKNRLAVVFDEFQEVTSYGDAAFEKRVRKEIQGHHRIAYVFSGSQRHLLSSMFGDTNRAFFKLAASYPLPKINTDHFISWAENLFVKGEKPIQESIVKEVVERCENHPMYVQEFLYHLWEEGLGNLGLDALEAAILERRTIEFINLFKGMTPNQKKAIKLVARSQGKGLFSARNLQSVGFTTPSQATRALNTLLIRDEVVHNGSWAIADPLFKRWILQLG
ncbi:hypothetical protein [Desulfoluna sp.]|uniref:AAA family ATPase n=1 Tax=Desulfoluna sp. TaxID=2045199 RepID=UPI0026154CD4|nr:hypothetical protein [Desulfoluna sp.]